MTTMIAEIYEAFIAAGTREDKAKAASTAIANYEGRFSRIEADLLVLKCMTGAVVAGVVSLVVKAFL